MIFEYRHGDVDIYGSISVHHLGLFHSQRIAVAQYDSSLSTIFIPCEASGSDLSTTVRTTCTWIVYNAEIMEEVREKYKSTKN